MPLRGHGTQSWPFDGQLRKNISINLENFSRKNGSAPGKKQAAVALVLTNLGEEPPIYGASQVGANEGSLILTRRSQKLQNHAGQWALPGGSIEPGETPEQTALRELQEEINLSLGMDSVLGRLDDFSTRSGFVMTPVVIWGGKDLSLQANPDEVASIHRIPLTEFMRKDAPLLESIPESKNPVLLMPVGTGWIATPTGAIIYQFREVALNGNQIRVSHYEQPYFAWQ